MRDLTGAPCKIWEAERLLAAKTGWGARLLARQNKDGNWGRGLYMPKWTSTTYTLLLLRDLGLPPGHPAALKACRLFLDHALCKDGGIDVSRSLRRSETCITGMVLSFSSYFRLDDPRINRLVQYLLQEQLPDGGWNCQRWRGAVHSSFHTTINVLEGLRSYAEAGGPLSSETLAAETRAQELLLAHRLFKSDHTGKVIDDRWTRFSFPPRWHYDVLRALEYFVAANASWDKRLSDAFDLITRRRRTDNTWPLQNDWKGVVFFKMEKAGRPSRWNTLRALRVLSWRESLHV
jgi:hypothetical protein